MKTLLKIDTFFQTLLFYVTLGLGVITLISLGSTFIFLGCSLFFLGAWQLLSGLLWSISLKNINRLRYFLGSSAYVLLLISGSNILELESIALGVIFVAAIPMMIAYWYLRLTNETLKEWDRGRKRFTENEMENILDSEEVLGI